MSPPPLLGLGLALAAAAGNNLGKGLQKAATRHLPQLNLGRSEVVLAYLSNPTWLLGLLLDVGGGGAMLGALAAAPVSLVQPVAAFGLVLLAGFSHFVLQERLGLSQWRGAALATLGIIGMGVSSSSSSSEAHIPPASAADHPPAPAVAAAAEPAAAAAAAEVPSPGRVLCCFLLLLGVLGCEVLWRQRKEAAAAARRRRGGGGAGVVGSSEAAAAADAATCGLEAGCCFGFSAAAARTGFQLSKTLGWLFVPLGVFASLCLTSSGFVLQTRGFKHGSALVVCTTAAAASIVAGVLVGLVALCEPLPTSPRLKLLLLGSWAAIFWGVSSMAGSEGNSVSNTVILASLHADGKQSHTHSHQNGLAASIYGRMQAVARELLLLLPRGVRRRLLPQHARQWLGRSGSSSSSPVGVWRALLGAGMAGKPGNSSSSGSSSSMDGQQQVQQQQQGLVPGAAAGASLPLSSSTPDFAAVLAPVGGARRS